MLSRLRSKRFLMLQAVAIFLSGRARISRAAEDLPDPVRLDEIVVTAERRETNLLETPASLTPLTGEQLFDASVTDIGQMASLVPNLFIDGSGYRRSAFHSIRGITSSTVSTTPAFGYYIDDVPHLRYSSVNAELLDIDRVEVLRGPQGTLYGRDAIGGVINVRTRDPTDEMHARAAVGLGNYELREGRVFAAGPLAGDRIRVSFSGAKSDRDGFTSNDFLGGRDVDFRDGIAGRAKLHVFPEADLSARLALWGERDRDGGTPWDTSERVCTRPFHVERDVVGRSDRDVYGTSGRLDYDGALPFRVTSVVGVQHFDVDILDDLIDLSALPLGAGNSRENQTQVTTELRAMSPDADETTLRWLAGLFYFHEDYDVGADFLFDPALGVPQLLRREDSVNQGFAVFGQATYTLLGTLDATLGLRYQGEWQDVTIREDTTAPAPSTQKRRSDASDGEWLPRFTLAQRWTPRQTTYVAIARGFRSGGNNIFFDSPDSIQYGPEFAWTYEIGHKALLFRDFVSVGATFFYTDYHDQQIQEVDVSAVRFRITNAGSSTIKGFELETASEPLYGASIGAGIGAQYGTFDDYDDPVLQQSYDGNTIPLAPQYNFNVGVQHQGRLPFGIQSLARVDVLGTGPMCANASNDAGFASYQLLNFRLGLEWRNLSGHFFMRNSLDDEYVPFGTVANGSADGFVQPGDPRTFGVVLRAIL
jgi:iron complex outermembrane recepter protein